MHNPNYIKVGNIVTLVEQHKRHYPPTLYIVITVDRASKTAQVASYSAAHWGLFAYNRAHAATNKISYPYTCFTRPFESLRCFYTRDEGKKVRYGKTVTAQWLQYENSFTLDHERERLIRRTELDKRLKELTKGMSQKKLDLLISALYLAYDSETETRYLEHKLKHFKEEGKT